MEELPELETPCPIDRGGERHYWFDQYYGGMETCHACNGSGFVPTAAGLKVLNLLAHHRHCVTGGRPADGVDWE